MSKIALSYPRTHIHRRVGGGESEDVVPIHQIAQLRSAPGVVERTAQRYIGSALLMSEGGQGSWYEIEGEAGQRYASLDLAIEELEERAGPWQPFRTGD